MTTLNSILPRIQIFQFQKANILSNILITPTTMAEIGIQTILALFTTISIISIIKPVSPPKIANIHVKAAKKTIPVTDNAALFVIAVALPPCPVPTLDTIRSKMAQTSAIPDTTSAITEITFGAVDVVLAD
jgi:hypothetical protein